MIFPDLVFQLQVEQRLENKYWEEIDYPKVREYKQNMMIATMISTKVKMMIKILSDWVLQLQLEQLTKCTAKRSGKGDTVQIAFSTSIFF